MKHLHFAAMPSRTTFRALLLLSALGAASATLAVTSYRVTVKNVTGGVVNDIHLVFQGTGGTIANRVVVNPGGGVILASLGNEFNASFNNLANNANFVGTFDCNAAGIIYNSGNWTKDGNNAGAINAADVTLEVVPEPASLAALGLGAAALLRRRRRG